jgi:hypothetical protein
MNYETMQTLLPSEIKKPRAPFKEPRNRFPAWRADSTTLFDVPVRLHRLADSIPWNRFLVLQIQALLEPLPDTPPNVQYIPCFYEQRLGHETDLG